MSLSALPEIVSIKKNAEIKELFANTKKIHTRYGLFFLSKESFSDQIGYLSRLTGATDEHRGTI